MGRSGKNSGNLPEQNGKNICQRRKGTGFDAPVGRWLYLVGVAERLAEISRDGRADAGAILNGVETNLTGLNEVFTRDIDPVTDMEGYAVRRLSLEMLALLRRLR